VRLEVQRPELVHTEDHLWFAGLGDDLTVSDRVQVLDPGLLHRVVRVCGGFPGLDALKGDALLTEQHPQALMADVVDHPSATRNSPSLAGLQVENGRPCSPGRDLAIFLISRRWPKVNFGGRPPLYLGYRELNPSALKLWITSRTRSSLVNATFAIPATSMPWADSSTICARRQVTTDPAVTAHEPHQPAALASIDLTHPHTLSHRPSLEDQPPPANRPASQPDLPGTRIAPCHVRTQDRG
jgi:hypothetical protein